MIDRVPLPDNTEYELVIKNEESSVVIRKLSLIGQGGSCIVYKGIKHI